MTGDERIAAAARAWNDARLLVVKLKDERGAFACETETAAWKERYANDGRRPDPDIPKPCWKTFSDDGDGGSERLDECEWCATCQRRQAVYLALRKAVQVRGAKVRSLYAAISAAG